MAPDKDTLTHTWKMMDTAISFKFLTSCLQGNGKFVLPAWELGDPKHWTVFKGDSDRLYKPCTSLEGVKGAALGWSSPTPASHARNEEAAWKRCPCSEWVLLSANLQTRWHNFTLGGKNMYLYLIETGWLIHADLFIWIAHLFPVHELLTHTYISIRIFIFV